MRAVLVTAGAGARGRVERRGRRLRSGFSTVVLFDTVAPRLTGFGEPSRFTF